MSKYESLWNSGLASKKKKASYYFSGTYKINRKSFFCSFSKNQEQVFFYDVDKILQTSGKFNLQKT